jgi:iron uptake system component EfeO
MTSRPRTRIGLSVAAGAVALMALSACAPNSSSTSSTHDGTKISVRSTASDCVLSAPTAPSGTVTFTVSNAADDVTEFYLLGSDGKRVVGEAENVAPGAPRTLTLQLKAGKYFTACKPGMVGDGVGRASFTVTSSGAKIDPASNQRQQGAAAAALYLDYVRAKIAVLVPATATFLNAYVSGDDAKARSLYATTRASYESIEPVAESFGDLDPKIDFREADVASGAQWTGWHRIEKDLWQPTAINNGGVTYVPLTPAERQSYADKLTADTQQLEDSVRAPSYSVSIDAISNGAIELMDEVATGKITGEEEIWSHTDLWDFQANVDGAKVAYQGVRDIVKAKNPTLVSQIDAEFTALQKELSGYGSLTTGFPYYNDLSTTQVKQLADSVNALSEPLSKLTAAVVK